MSLFPSCGEASLTFIPMDMGEVEDVGPSRWDKLPEELKNCENNRRAASRSKGAMRRFMVHNRLVKMWVLTFAGEGLHGEDGYRQAMREMHTFIKRMRRNFFGGRDVPYLYSLEPHPDGHGWHVNLMLRDVYIDKHQMQRCWGNGNVWYTDFTKDREDWLGRSLGRSSKGGARAGARRAASYAAKYIGKDLEDEDGVPVGAHRYEVAQGFQPKCVRVRVKSFAAGHRLIGGHPSFGSLVWHGMSSDWDAWTGPPCEVVFFDAPNRPGAGGAAGDARRRRPPGDRLAG